MAEFADLHTLGLARRNSPQRPENTWSFRMKNGFSTGTSRNLHIAGARICLLSLAIGGLAARAPASDQFELGQVLTGQTWAAESVFAVDIDGDGDPDVLSASYGDNKVAWYENLDGLGTYGPQHIITTDAQGVKRVCAADLDGDNDPDVLSASSLTDEIAWYENTDGNGTFGPKQVITTLAENARWVVTADLDGDLDQDVLSASVMYY